ncbi:hypothetical protein [Microlunatus antarcticus]|uniref:Uncharacterized protein n=1 Tax=Microlunatus antarcticus TaxID=53388 RepID=A0A7W5JU83_9ACTN|nr:hypothetical protein [Microlunatus antarcticus]MBB3326383.1 hypothetical protein [Microlunatus antarcticus]
MSTSRNTPLSWRIEREVVLTDKAPLASLVSVAFDGSEYYLVARGDIPAVVGRPFDPELDIPIDRLQVSLEVEGRPAEQSSGGSTADRDTWETLQQWEGPEPAPELRVTLELDGRSCEYLLTLVT